MAPELFQKKSYDKTVDQYAFGAVLWEIFAREIPFDGIEPTDIMEKVKKDDNLSARSSIPNEIMQIIKECRKVDPTSRPSFEKINNDLSKL